MTRNTLSRLAPLVLLALVLGATLLPGALAQNYYDRNEVPGNYTIGFYSDFSASSRSIALEKGQDEFEAFIGITGDSTRVFSGVVFRLDLPPGVTMTGPAVWRPIAGLKQMEPMEGRGTQVTFNQECVPQEGDAPVVIGRIPLRMDPDVQQAVIEPLDHVNFGLSVELCQPDRSWPKPFAEGLALTVERKRSFWDRVTSWFD